MPADVARCVGRTETHPYRQECEACMRKLSPPHEWQNYITPWEEAHGPCPDKLEMEV